MPVDVAKTVEEIRLLVRGARERGRRVALVPTMGALHVGHGALMERARREAEFVVVSIFVNPIQFDRREDYEAYLIHLDEDVAFCEARGVDAVFAPPVEVMYPQPQSTFVEVSGVSEHLCGAFRPGHFRGVATVVSKLFHIVLPDVAYFGEKDAQQLAVIERMVAELNIPVEIVPVPTAREADGLAISSRNRRLGAEERLVAPVLFQALEAGRRSVSAGSPSSAHVKRAALEVLAAHPEMRVEYLEVVGAASMAPVEEITAPVRIAAAVWLGTTRLIDNVYCDFGR